MKLSKTAVMVLGIFFLAFSLRTLSSFYLDVGTDEMIYSLIPYNIISAHRLSTVEQSPLYFYLVDIGYRLFGGLHAFSLRFTSILFGALTAIVVFLLSRDIFGSRRAALLSAFFFALSGYALFHSTEMDMVAYFFVFLSFWLLGKSFLSDSISLSSISLNSTSSKYIYLATASFALAVLNKVTVALFLPALLLQYWFLHQKNSEKITESFQNIFSHSSLRRILLVLGIFLLLLFPWFAYNYLLYQDKGVTDYYVSNILGIGETVHQGLQNKPWSFARLQENSAIKLQKFWQFDALLLVLGVLGIIWSMSRWRNQRNVQEIKRETTVVLLCALIIPFFYLAGQTGSGNHYLFVSVILSIFAGGAADHLGNILQERKSWQWGIPLLVLGALLFTGLLLTTLPEERSNSITLELRDYTRENIPENAVVVLDPRIYNGIHAWVFHDRHYIEGTQFFQVLQMKKEGMPREVEVPLFYIACGPGSNCGWKPEDFTRITPVGEEVTSFFQERTKKISEVHGGQHTFHIYQGAISLPESTFATIDRTHIFWFYPVGWKYPELAIDSYPVEGAEKLIQGMGLLVLYTDVLLVVFFIGAVLYWGTRKEEEGGKCV